MKSESTFNEFQKFTSVSNKTFKKSSVTINFSYPSRKRVIIKQDVKVNNFPRK